MKESIILTGGGTAGHIMPNLALLPALQKQFKQIYYLGSSNSMEQKILSEYKSVKFIEIPTTKLVRKFTLKNLCIPFKLIASIAKTKKIIKKINPDVIFCKGGFVSVPVAIAGKLCRVPVISHESDFSLGLANKIILKFANAVCTSFSDTARASKKCIYTGSPIRAQIFNGDASKVKSQFKPNAQKPYILFFGGSLGSKFINAQVQKALTELCKKYNVLHITGKGNKISYSAPNYLQVEFCSNIEDFFACADAVICRGGANSLFELLALSKPMLIIPLSKAQSRGDQIENAEYFKVNHGAHVLYEEQTTPKVLISEISKIIAEKDKIKATMLKSQPDANQKIIEIIKRQ